MPPAGVISDLAKGAHYNTYEYLAQAGNAYSSQKKVQIVKGNQNMFNYVILW